MVGRLDDLKGAGPDLISALIDGGNTKEITDRLIDHMPHFKVLGITDNDLGQIAQRCTSIKVMDAVAKQGEKLKREVGLSPIKLATLICEGKSDEVINHVSSNSGIIGAALPADKFIYSWLSMNKLELLEQAPEPGTHPAPELDQFFDELRNFPSPQADPSDAPVTRALNHFTAISG